ncbi:hypothetical protein AB1E18_011437 [Capra hircus]
MSLSSQLGPVGAPDTPASGRGGEERGRFLPGFQWENKEKRRQLRNLGLGPRRLALDPVQASVKAFGYSPSTLSLNFIFLKSLHFKLPRWRVIAEESAPHFRKGVPYPRAPGSRMRDHLIHERVMFHLRIDA